MFKSRQMVVTAALILVASSAMANNFRAADQVYLPVAGHLTAGAGTFVSDVFISNVTSDSVTVSVIYTPTTNLSGTVQASQYFNNILTLAPNERRELNDFLFAPAPNGLGLSAAFGTLVFNGCRANANCTVGQAEDGSHPDFRDIAVLSRIYLIPTGQNPSTAATTGQDIAGIPWYHYASSRAAAAGLQRIAISGFRQTGTAGQAGTYRGNLGVMNASQFSSTTLLLQLWTGANRSTPVSTRRVTLGPLNHIQASITDLFQGVVAGPNTTNLYVTIEQESSTPVAGAPASCGTDGCPAFVAYGAVLDNVTGDATTLEAIYEKALTADVVTAIYGKTGTASNYRRVVRRAP